jgi:hypothetical protein
MLRTEQDISRVFRLSDRLSVEMTLFQGGLSVVWDPSVPDDLTLLEMGAYVEARNEMIRMLMDGEGVGMELVQ